MLNALKSFKFYLKYYLTNHVVNRVPFHAFRLGWYRRFMGIKIGGGSQIWLGCRFVGDTIDQVEIGRNTVLASDVMINASAFVHIGDHVNIAHEVCILTSVHDCQDPDFAPIKDGVTIRSQAWIGTRAMIQKGVTVGEGAVVAACAVVMHDVKPLAIVAGSPARQYGTRAAPSPPASKQDPPPLFC